MISKNVLLVGLLVGIILISGCVANKQELSTTDNCNVKIPQTIKMVAREAYASTPIDSDYVEIHIPGNLCITSYPSDISGYYIVQFKGPIYEDYKNQVISQGGILYFSLPEHAFVVKMNENTKNKVQDLEIVRWVGIYQPAYKIASSVEWIGVERKVTMPLLNKTGDITLTIGAFGGENMRAVNDKIESLGGRILVTSGDTSRVLIDASKIPNIANILDVQFIEEYREPRII